MYVLYVLFDAVKCVLSIAIMFYFFLFFRRFVVLMVCCPVAQQVRPLSLAAKPPRHSKDAAVRFHFMHFHALRLLKLTRVHWRPAFLECFGLGRAGCALSILEVL